MNRPSQLTQLIWDFYRENQSELKQLKLLAKCKVFRRWGIFYIRCFEPEVASRMIRAIAILEEPIAKLRLAHKIKILVDHQTVAVFQVKSDKTFV
ncbi:hypothetical protein QPK87_12015 [Kamptonema cortianum]|nr:hypothetical protein [Oscillatoria laete-virens]MCD8485962.1 hypothetical protein [Desertifilum sp.]MDI9639130.1 hypothetical protein [Geitlerinema splendidum]MDK3157297.1 hypothetical protein [Kamptonema cortianum]MDL5052944.1 hypothetical protein [Oscillatoria laete-virens NRMC-F 0139]